MTHEPSSLLQSLGRRVRALRTSRDLTLQELARRAGVSARFLGDVEGGRGNISIVRLDRIAHALGLPIDRLLRDGDSPLHHDKVALVGLRGAGKTTIGERVARRLGVPFIELDQRIEDAAGMRLSDLFSIHGEPYYRRLERDAVQAVVAEPGRAVVATGGGIVNDPEAWSALRSNCLTIWLEARAGDHWNRVIAQGDQRPMDGNPGAMTELRALLKTREPLYARAHRRVDTSRLGLAGAVDAVVEAAAAADGGSLPFPQAEL